MEIDRDTNGVINLSVHVKLKTDNYIRVFKSKSENKTAVFHYHAI